MPCGWTPPSGPDGTAAERSRFSILADDGGRFGQDVRHRSGVTRLTTGNATVETAGPFFRWLDGVWGRRALRAPEGYDCEFTLGWLGYLGYELKRETGGSDVPSDTPDACLIFAGRAVVLDHLEGTAWLARPGRTRRRRSGWRAPARPSRRPRPPARRPGTAAASTAVGLGSAAAPAFTAPDTEHAYKAKIADAQHEIAEGNTYEVCLTTAAHAPTSPADRTGWTPGRRTWPCAGGTRRRSPATCGSASSPWPARPRSGSCR